MKLKVDKKILNKANRKAFKIIQKVIDTKRRSYDGHKLKKRTGNLRSEIKPLFRVEQGKIVVDVETMTYYQWLDDGTARIKPWFLTEEIMEHPEMEEVIEMLLYEGINGAVVNMVSIINKDN